MAWQVQLVGDSADLRMLAEALSDPSLSISEKNGEFVLSFSDFASMIDAGKVRARANELVTSLSGLARLVLGSHRPLGVGAVTSVNAAGSKHIYVSPEPAKSRNRAFPVGMTIGRADGTVEVHMPGDPIRE